jgi:hypothetical protein
MTNLAWTKILSPDGPLDAFWTWHAQWARGSSVVPAAARG